MKIVWHAWQSGVLLRQAAECYLFPASRRQAHGVRHVLLRRIVELDRPILDERGKEYKKDANKEELIGALETSDEEMANDGS